MKIIDRKIKKYQDVLATLKENKRHRAKDDNYNYDVDIMNTKWFIQDLQMIKKDSVSNSILVNWWYMDENSTEVTVIGIVDNWCVVEDNEHDEPYCVELEFVQNMYKDSIDC